MTHALVKIKLIVMTTGVAFLLAGMFFLVCAGQSRAAPVECAIDQKPGQKSCEAIEAETPAAITDLKTVPAATTIFAKDSFASEQDGAGEGTGELVSLAPLPPAAMLFGGAIAGLLYLGRRRKVKAVQED